MYNKPLRIKLLRKGVEVLGMCILYGFISKPNNKNWRVNL